MERRDFLKVVGATAATGVLAHCGGWGVYAPPGVKADAPDNAGRVKFKRDQFKELAKVGGAVMVTAPSVGTPMLLMRVGDSDYRATSGLCTHVQCPVGYVASSKIIECPCHGAQFNLDGKVLRKPATSALTAFPVRVDPDTGDLYIDTNGTNVPSFENGKIEFILEDLGVLIKRDDFFAFTPSGLERPIIMVRYESARIFAADATCTFGPSVLGYNVERRRYQCPGHGCEFDFDGTVAQGPATKPLRVLPVEFDGTTARVTVPA